jgi:hypothetical protein
VPNIPHPNAVSSAGCAEWSSRRLSDIDVRCDAPCRIHRDRRRGGLMGHNKLGDNKAIGALMGQSRNTR